MSSLSGSLRLRYGLKNFSAEKNENAHPLEKWAKVFLPFLIDKRDLPFLILSIQIALVLLPLFVLILNSNQFQSIWLCGIYFIFWYRWSGPYVVMLHNICHRPMIKLKYRKLADFFQHGIGLLFGQAPYAYVAHHLLMHHVENNSKDDFTSTLQYQRDSLADFFKYYFKFLFFSTYWTYQYCSKIRGKKHLKYALGGDLALYLFFLAVTVFHPVASLVLCWVPYLFTRFLLLSSNWAQHAFVDPNCPSNPLRNTIVCANTRMNTLCFNEGYHLIHHLKPGLHWAEVPNEFAQLNQKLISEKTLVFNGLDFTEVWFFLVTQQYERLAASVLQGSHLWKDAEELVSDLKERTQVLPPKAFNVHLP